MSSYCGCCVLSLACLLETWLTAVSLIQIRRCASEHSIMLTVEEGAIGGLAAHVMQFLALDGLLDGALKFRPMTLPDRFIDHGSQPQQLADAGIDAAHIARTVMSLMGKKAHSLSV